MAHRGSRNQPQQQQQQQQMAAQPSSSRQNEYFIPRDGIDREVITADICRYLGNDALVRPGNYETSTGQVTQGYFITAYRNLTTAMIDDLKADSARWDQERRVQSVRNAGVQYRNSETHSMRHQLGPSGDTTHADPTYDTPKYPGSGQYQASRDMYTPQSGGSYAPTYGNPGYGPPSAGQYGAQPDPRYGAPASSAVMSGYPPEQQPYLTAGGIYSNPQGSYDAYGNPTVPRDRMVTTGALPASQQYVTAPAQSSYSPSGGYYPGPVAGTYQPTHPQDAFMGRAPQGSQLGYPTGQYEEAVPRTTGQNPRDQSGRRAADRDSEKPERHHKPPRR